MKIALIELMPFPYTVGGGTTHLMNLGKALVKLGNEVHIISSKPAENYGYLKNCPKELIVHNVGMKHKKFDGSGRGYYLYRLLFEISFILSAMKKIKEIKPDIIDCQSAITTALPASFSGYPFVITCHGIHSQGFEKLYESKGKGFAAKSLNKIYSAIAKYNVKRAKKIISQGNTTLDYYLNLAGDKKKGLLVPNLVDTDYWAFTDNKKEKLIVTVARLTKQKALDKLVIAMKDLKNFDLMIAGDGEMEKELKSLAGKNVKFLGYQTQDQCKQLYKKARFTVLPSEFEGLPYSILESMSSGVIPITTKVGDLQVLIEDNKNGFLLENNKPETIAKTIKKADKSKKEMIAKAARKTIIDKYGLESVAKKFISLYKDSARK